MRANYKMPRLFIEEIPPQGGEFSPKKEQTHYLLHVLRLQQGQNVLLFDGKNGEWRARCVESGKRSLILQVEEQTRPQPQQKRQLVYCFAPLKQARLDYMAQKAVEMGASFLQPVISQYTQIRQLKTERIAANIIEAAEQCGELRLAACAEPLPLSALLQIWQNRWGNAAKLIFCDEAQITQEYAQEQTDTGLKTASSDNDREKLQAAISQNPLPALLALKAAEKCNRQSAVQQKSKTDNGSDDTSSLPPVGLLIGPEGGFSEAERRLLYAQDFVTAIPLGNRILRADTAAVAALALIQAVIGDW